MYRTDSANPTSSGDQNDAYQRARARVHRLRGFYSHLFTYVVIVAFLAVLNLWTNPSYPWVLWVAFGWGIGILFHAYSTFVTRGPLGAEWERRKIRQLMDREQGQAPPDETPKSQ
jgi:hypothetical protein